jgi:hypothetical protein
MAAATARLTAFKEALTDVRICCQSRLYVHVESMFTMNWKESPGVRRVTWCQKSHLVSDLRNLHK